MLSNPIYLDYNATTPVHPEVSKAMAATLGSNWFDGVFGNPSSAHCYGKKAHDEIELARVNVAQLLGASPSEIIFTSCGSESNNLAILGACKKFKDLYPSRQCEIIVSSVDHPSVKKTCEFATDLYNAKIIEIPVNQDGQIDTEYVLEKVNENTCIVTIMFANNEIGTLLNVPETFKKIIAKRETVFPLLHSDCAQAIGKVPVRVNVLHCDLLSVAGHKFYGPKGVGALYIRDGVKIPCAVLHGAGQECGMRPGTENITGIVGIGKAAELAFNDMKARLTMQAEYVKELFKILSEKCGKSIEIKVNGNLQKRLCIENSFDELIRKLIESLDKGENEIEESIMKLGCLPGTLSISFKDIEAMDIVAKLSDRVCTSVGSACHSKCRQVSAVLAAIGLNESFAFGTFRISVGCGLTKDMVEKAANLLADEILASK